MAEQQRFQVLEHRAAPDGFGADAIALVTFGCRLSSFEGVVPVFRWDKKNKLNRVTAELHGVTSIKVIDAVVRRGNSGTPWLAVNGFGLPSDIGVAVAKEVAAFYTTSSPAQQPGDVPIGPIDSPSDQPRGW